MLDRILKLLNHDEAAAELGRLDDLQLAVAALLVEAARMDDHFDPSSAASRICCRPASRCLPRKRATF
jgi:hypothetical protein